MTKDKHILIKNIYYMLSYAFMSLEQSIFDDVEKEKFEDIHNLFAAILAKGIGQQLKQGLHREYLSKEENSFIMRGKLDMAGTISNKIARTHLLSCEYDELSENNIFNRILKTTVMILLRFGKVDSKYKDALKKEMLFFSTIDTIESDSIAWPFLRFSRYNQTYQMLISICQLILQGLLMTTEQGDCKLASFIDDQRMSRLYEKFILEYYISHFPHLNAKASEIHWALDDGAGTMLPLMQSDITLSNKDKILIIDAKYYSHTTQVQYDVPKLHSNNLYQIFTYVKNNSCEKKENPYKVSGMLLYARTDEAIQPDNVYQMSGSRISVQTLDLNNDFNEISRQLSAIAESHFGEIFSNQLSL